MWIKICGNTRLEDCLLATALGADAVGFVFAEGRRTVTAEQVAEIVRNLPASIGKIGVFTSIGAAEIADTAGRSGLTGIQMHSKYNPQILQGLRSADTCALRIVQVVPWDVGQSAHEQLGTFREEIQRIGTDGLADELLIDSRSSNVSGGTGRTFDWAAAMPVLQQATLPLIVAGGLNPGNVAQAIRVLRPWGVDVSSGVEDAPGIKNADGVRRFVAQARATG